MTNPASVSLQDLMYAYYKAAYNGTANDPGSVTLGSGIKTLGAGAASNVAITSPLDGGGNVKVTQQGAVVSPQVSNRYGSINNSGVQTAPTAGTVIATVATFDFYYEVKVIVGFGATAETTTVDNFKLKADTTLLATIPVANVANTQSQVYTFYLNPGAAAALNVTSGTVNGSASSVYKATIIATRLV